MGLARRAAATSPVTEIFRVEMLPAQEGDCVVLVYGDAEHPRRIMVDGGRAATYRAIRDRFSRLPGAERTFELLIVSHVDRDHIEGTVAMLEDPTSPIQFRDVWFNSYDHLRDPAVEAFGAVQGERLTAALRQQPSLWNRAFHGRSAEIRPGESITLEDGLHITLLSPDRRKLEAMLPVWHKECQKAGLIPGIAAQRPPPPAGLERFGRVDIDQLADQPFIPDRSEPNGTSIAILARYGAQRILLAADAHADRLIESVRPLATAEGGRLRLDAFKLPHHGSKYNVCPELLDLVSCPRYLVSTNGSYFDHPDTVAIARVIKHGGDYLEIIFNYRSDEALLWNNPRWQQRFGYRTTYPCPVRERYPNNRSDCVRPSAQPSTSRIGEQADRPGPDFIGKK
jgi:beta-lactamase superfamily II metal-dependent hydrolase